MKNNKIEGRKIRIDCFAGGGGASQGARDALHKDITIAINHDPAAILMHKTNHPDTLHLTEDIFQVDLRKYLKENDEVEFMWGSPDCTSHSKAKGGQPRKRGLRVLPWSIYRLCLQILEVTGKIPKILFMENVEEIQKWCPLDENGRPIKELFGCCYQCFIKHMATGSFQKDGRPLDCQDKCNQHCDTCIVTKEQYNISLGFDMKSQELVAADYGAPTTRKRWYAIFRSDKQPIVFPKQTHDKLGDNGLLPWIPVSNVIDWTDLGKSIFTRKKPLAEATQNRIARGIKKYIVDNPKPFFVPEKEATAFLIQYHGEQKEGDSRGQRLNEPIKTIDTSNRYGLVTAFITKFYKTGTGQRCDEPLHTITTSPGHFGLVSAFLVKYYGQGVGQKIDQPLGTIVTKDRFGLVNVVFTIAGEKYIISDILFRMLNPEELKLAQGFPKSYVIDRDYTGKKYPIKERVARIGNSVVPVMAQALIEANCQELIDA